MNYAKYNNLLGEDGYIDYDGIRHLIEENERLQKLVACPDCLGYGGLDATDCGGPYIMCESCKGSGTWED
ncbi:MAG TPA: hypothetical protein DHN29_17710 [Cytophagales bacterium]|nr:hypothetical protein [Cytophagales bacterium]